MLKFAHNIDEIISSCNKTAFCEIRPSKKLVKNIGEHPTITDTFRNANNLKDDGHKAK
ncbi:hypothetical protein ACLKA6_018417, partial [Drosophila palustris]